VVSEAKTLFRYTHEVLVELTVVICIAKRTYCTITGRQMSEFYGYFSAARLQRRGTIGFVKKGICTIEQRNADGAFRPLDGLCSNHQLMLRITWSRTGKEKGTDEE